MRKYLARIVAVMCAVVVLSFASILLNGTVFFFAAPDHENDSDLYFEDLIVGQPELRRIDKQLVWVTYLSTSQRDNLKQLTNAQVKLEQSCDISQDYCLLFAETEQSGINLQYTASMPTQLPSGLPWFGGFVNPLNGSVYDLLGRAYSYQGTVEPLVVIELN